MTIKQTSKIVSLALAAIVLIFAVAAGWSLNHLNRAFASVEFFGQQKDKIFTQVSQPIFSYLLSGDATLLGKIEQSLTQVQEEVERQQNLSADLKKPFEAVIAELQDAMMELRAAGKLADPQQLLVNNERMLSQHLQLLSAYVGQAQKAGQADKQRYLSLINATQAELIDLARARQNFFSAHKAVSPDSLNQQLQALIALGNDMKNLPLLGVMKKVQQEDDMFSLGEEKKAVQTEDMALEPLREIPSLLEHYSKDLQLALKITQDKLVGQEKVNGQIAQLQQRLIELEAEITGEYQFYERITIAIMAVSALMIILAVLVTVLGGRRVLRRISALEATMFNIAQTSDLSLRAADDHRDEIGSMAGSFNAMVEKLQETSKLVRQKINDIQTMLQNMPQGLLSFDDRNTVKPEYSAFLEKILETEQIAGSNLIDLVFKDSSVGSDTIAQISAIAGACVGEDAMNFEFNQHLLVNEVEKQMPNGERKVLDLNWAPVVNDNDVVDQILLCIRDVTELRKLSAEAEEQKRELEIIGEILGVNQEKFHEFITSALSYIDEIENTIRANPDGGQDAVNAMFRNMHTIKGNARTYGLANLTNRVHDVESVYDELRKDNAAIAWDQARLLDDLAQLRDFVEHYAKTNEVSLGRKGPGRRGSVERYLMVDKKQIQDAIKLLDKVSHSNIHDLIEAKTVVHKILRLLGTESLESALSAIVDSLPALARQLDKEAPQIALRDNGLLLKTQSMGVVKDIFTHLLRNCLDHGLEPAAERLGKGKQAQGRIEVDMGVEGGKLKIAVRDDGRGLALSKIRQKALANGMLAENETVGDDRIAGLIFLPGFSTADKLSDISGRGVGMDAVMGFARKEGGEVKINFLDEREGEDYRAFETALYLPESYAVAIDQPTWAEA